MFMVLPPELVDVILEEVDDEASLKMCSLAARSLVIPSQRSLFRSLYLYTNANLAHHASSTCAHARAVFTSSPHLAKYVRTLTLCLARETAENYEPVQAVLQMVTLVSRLAIHGSSDKFRWDSMSPALVSSILLAVQRPAIQGFHLKRIRGVPSSLMFYAASAFRIFTVERLEILEETGSSVILPQRCDLPTRLEEIVIPAAFRTDAICTFLLDLNAQGRLQHLRRVAWRVYGSPSRHWDRLLQEVTLLRTLQHVELWFTLQFPRIELPCFPNVRTLELKCRMDTPSIPSSIQSIIAKLPTTAPHLERLILSLRVSARSHPLVPQIWLHNIEPLLPFDTHLYVQRLPRLRQVYCCLKDSAADLYDGFGPYMQRKFPGPQTAGILLCEMMQGTSSIHR
ncbi:hypothetical protein B0H17DRAFT_1102800 [Mycena rosella]|uniref:F-box domain-containing protein n=1 Tax=Mycena rosella TaxID=1033263 RepID=A0AAD7CHA9_MYCRO|nr:hypothetical protein B0H17DRAFT_1102800 [Mycena rosella]